VGTKAAKILNDIVEQAQAGFESLPFETADVNLFREKLTDYTEAVEKVSQQNKIKIYTGKTAPLPAEEIQQDRCLGSLIIYGQSRLPTNLVKMAFAAEQLGEEASKLGPFDPAKPKMYVSFGPLVDSMGTIIAMARVIEVENSAVPSDINLSFQKNLPSVFEDEQQKEKTFVLKEKVKQDCRKLKAFETARQKANEFAELAKNKGWDNAIEKFNSLYPAQTSLPKSAKDGNETQKTFKIQNWNNKSRISQADIEIARIRTAHMPGVETLINQSTIHAKLMDNLYSLFKPNEIQLENVPAVVEFKPQLACYVIKSLSRNPVTTEKIS
jgi:hypothetical protein